MTGISYILQVPRLIENQPGKVSAAFECVEPSVFPLGNKGMRMLPMMHWMVDSRSGFLFLLVVAFVVAAVTYAIPIFLAWTMGSPYLTAITLLDLLLGWTILGWIAALIWAIASGNGGTFDEDGPSRHNSSV